MAVMYRVKKRLYNCVFAKSNRDKETHIFKLVDDIRVKPTLLKCGEDFELDEKLNVISIIERSALFGERQHTFKVEEHILAKGTLDSVVLLATRKKLVYRPTPRKN